MDLHGTPVHSTHVKMPPLQGHLDRYAYGNEPKVPSFFLFQLLVGDVRLNTSIFLLSWVKNYIYTVFTIAKYIATTSKMPSFFLGFLVVSLVYNGLLLLHLTTYF